MTTEQRDGILSRVGRILDERIGIARWYRQNACKVHGLPFEDNSELRIVVEQPQGSATAATAAPTSAAMPSEATAKAESQPGLLQWINGAPWWLKAGAIAAGGFGVSQWLSKPAEQPPAVVTPAEQTTSGSITAYLSDNGFNVPEGNTNGK